MSIPHEPPIIFAHMGHCNICEGPACFSAYYEWYRDHLLCRTCQTIPRERALMRVLTEYYPNWRELDLHESSPGVHGLSLKLKEDCQGYSASHYFPDIPFGSTHPELGFRNESLEELTFEDNSLDLIITQDVMEHVFHPNKAFAEIARVLKPGGAHIFSVPIQNKTKPSQRRAKITKKGVIKHLIEPAEYHGNPVDPDGALVTFDWGYDIATRIMKVAKTPTMMFQIDDIDAGIRAKYIEIFASFKPEN